MSFHYLVFVCLKTFGTYTFISIFRHKLEGKKHDFLVMFLEGQKNALFATFCDLFEKFIIFVHIHPELV